MATTSLQVPRRLSAWLILGGLVFAAIGVLAILHPLATDLTTSFVLALCFLVAGLGSFVSTFSGDDPHHRLISLSFGVMAIGMGIFLAAFPLDGAVSLAWLIGAFLAATGAVELVAALRGEANRGVNLLLGVVDVGLGVLILGQLPQGALDMLAILVGVSFLARAAALFVLAAVLSRSFPRAD